MDAETLEPFKAAGVGETHNIYDIIPDTKNNAWFTDIAADYIGKVDRDTMKVQLFQMPITSSLDRTSFGLLLKKQ